MRFAAVIASNVNHYQHQQQLRQQLNGVADDAAIINNTAEHVDDTTNVIRGQSLSHSIIRYCEVMSVLMLA